MFWVRRTRLWWNLIQVSSTYLFDFIGSWFFSPWKQLAVDLRSFEQITLPHPLHNVPHQDQVVDEHQGEDWGPLQAEVVFQFSISILISISRLMLVPDMIVTTTDFVKPTLSSMLSEVTFLYMLYIIYSFSTRPCSKFKVGGSMGLWLGLGVIQAIQLFAKYLLPFFRWKTREGSIKVAGWMCATHFVCSSSMQFRFLLEGVQMTCRPCLKICYCQCFDVNIIVVDLSYPPIDRANITVDNVIYSIECIYCHLCRTSGKYQNLVIRWKHINKLMSSPAWPVNKGHT